MWMTSSERGRREHRKKLSKWLLNYFLGVSDRKTIHVYNDYMGPWFAYRFLKHIFFIRLSNSNATGFCFVEHYSEMNKKKRRYFIVSATLFLLFSLLVFGSIKSTVCFPCLNDVQHTANHTAFSSLHSSKFCVLFRLFRK